MAANKIATEKLYWNASRTKLVKQGNKDAAFLACIPGQPIPKSVEPEGDKSKKPQGTK